MLSILYHWNIPTLCRSSCVIICYTCNKVKLLNFTVSKNDQVFYPLIQWDSLFLLSDIMLWHWTSFITRGILFQKLNWYRQQDLMILSQCHSLTAEVKMNFLVKTPESNSLELKLFFFNWHRAKGERLGEFR